jgi:NAD(P)-dependent dehydrogenase (short-subunit alcohol dehydrogenase family)
LENRRILVVGASRGIGRGIATACAEAGARLALAARSVEQLDAFAEQWGSTIIGCDVRDDAGSRRAVDEAVDVLGGLDALVYSTGITAYGRVSDCTRETWEDVFATNVFGAHSVTAAAVPHLEASKGHAIFLNSESALYQPDQWPGIAAYVASKRALESLVRSFRMEHPLVAFTSYFVGSTVSDIPFEGLEPFVPTWMERHFVETTNALLPEDHGRAVVALLSMGERVLVDAVNMRPRHFGVQDGR